MVAENDEIAYSESHSSKDYGKRYTKTYSYGYYHEQWIKLEKPLLISILHRLKEKGYARILDFACGTGRILSVNETIFNDSIGFDISESMLSYARERCPKSNIIVHDIKNGPLNNSFDIITAFRFFINAEDELRVSALSAINQMLNTGGVLVTNCHQNSYSFLGFAYRVCNFILRKKKYNLLSYSEFSELLNKQGFQIIDTYWYSYFPRLGWHFNFLPKYLLVPFEKLWKKVPFLPERFSQSFMVVACKI